MSAKEKTAAAHKQAKLDWNKHSEALSAKMAKELSLVALAEKVLNSKTDLVAPKDIKEYRKAVSELTKQQKDLMAIILRSSDLKPEAFAGSKWSKTMSEKQAALEDPLDFEMEKSPDEFDIEEPYNGARWNQMTPVDFSDPRRVGKEAKLPKGSILILPKV